MPGVFFAAPILTPILPSPPSRSRLSTPARFAPALVISRYVSDSPRAKTPWGERVQATIPPPGVPPPATCPVTKPEPMVFGRKISPGYAFQPPRCAGAARALVDFAARQRAEQTRYGVPPAFSSRDLRRMRARRPKSRGLRGHHLPRLRYGCESSVPAPTGEKKHDRPLTICPPTPRSERNRS